MYSRASQTPPVSGRQAGRGSVTAEAAGQRQSRRKPGPAKVNICCTAGWSLCDCSSKKKQRAANGAAERRDSRR